MRKIMKKDYYSKNYYNFILIFFIFSIFLGCNNRELTQKVEKLEKENIKKLNLIKELSENIRELSQRIEKLERYKYSSKRENIKEHREELNIKEELGKEDIKELKENIRELTQRIEKLEKYKYSSKVEELNIKEELGKEDIKELKENIRELTQRIEKLENLNINKNKKNKIIKNIQNTLDKLIYVIYKFYKEKINNTLIIKPKNYKKKVENILNDLKKLSSGIKSEEKKNEVDKYIYSIENIIK